MFKTLISLWGGIGYASWKITKISCAPIVGLAKIEKKVLKTACKPIKHATKTSYKTWKEITRL